MEFWKIAALTTWVVITILILIFIYFRKKWFAFSKDVFLGQRLHTSINQLFKEIASKNIKEETLANISKHILWRFTRIGMFAILAVFVPIMFLSIQTYLLKVQNDRLDLQNNLIEAQRQGSLVILMSNIMDQLNEEINTYKKDKVNVSNNSKGYPLSEPLIGRIAGLSEGFLPYRIYQNEILLKQSYSTERGQLLLSLVNSHLDSMTIKKIYSSTTFRQSYLRRVKLRKANLRRVNLFGAYLNQAVLDRADLRGATLSFVDFSEATLFGADLSEATLRRANFQEANLMGVDFKSANLFKSNLNNTTARGANFYNANLSQTDISESDFREADFRETSFFKANLNRANFSGADLGNARKLTKSQLIKVKSLFGVRNLDENLKQRLELERPCLFTRMGCE